MRVNFNTATSGVTAPAPPAFGVTYDPNSGQSGTATAGPGSVNLLTGELTVTDTDASAFGISISRSYGSRSTDAGTADKAAGAFGPQWQMGGVAETAQAAYTQLKKTSATSVSIATGDGSTLAFNLDADGSGAWYPEPGAEAFQLTGATTVSSTVSTYTLTDTDSGVLTTFTQDTSVANTPTDLWPVSAVNPINASTGKGSTRYLYQADTAGKLRLLRLAAPNPALPDTTAAQCVTASVALTALPAGCRVLAPVWSTVTVGSGTAARVTQIDLYATDPATPTAAPIASTLTTYAYDTNGYLTAVTDPRPGLTGGTGASYPGQAALTTSYSYAADASYPTAKTLDANGNVTTTSVTKPGRLATITPTGRQPWTLHYSADAGPGYEQGQPGYDGRIAAISRPTLAAGTVDQTDGTATTAIVYGVPLTQAAGGPQDMTRAVTRWWNQTIPPTDATAVFPPGVPAGANTGDHWASDDTTNRDWTTATVSYLDVNGRTVNTETPVTGATPAIDATQYDLSGNPTFALTAGNRATVMGANDPAETAAGGPTATAIWGNLGLSTAALPADLTAAADTDPTLVDIQTHRAAPLASLTTYETGPISGAERATVTEGPVHAVMTGSGPTGSASATPGRAVTVTTYDQNRPAATATPAPAATAVDLPTTVVQGTLPGATASYPATALVDTRTSTTAYDWTLGLPTTAVTDPGGLAITNNTSYDSLGRLIKTAMPTDPNGAAADSTVTAYYAPGANGVCGSSADATVWGGLPCTTGPAAAIAGAPAGSATTLPTTTSQYGRTGVVTQAVETSGAMTRTSTTKYDAADRPHEVNIVGTGSGWTTSTPTGTALTRTTIYGDTGDVTAVTDPSTGGSITTTTDTLGRVATTTDATGLTATTTYDGLDRPTSTVDSGTIAGTAQSFTTTNSYDPTTGRLTGGNDTSAGHSTASYDLDGQLVAQSWTDAAGGALSDTTLTDTTGAATSKMWKQGNTTLLADTTTSNGAGQMVTDSQTMPTLAATVAGSSRTRRYGYDADGRLVSAADTRQAAGSGATGATNASTTCVVRAWAFDANSNRTGEAGTTPIGSACAATGYTVPATSGAGATAHSYDSADRITDTVAGVAASYDAFGRTTATNGTTAGAPGTTKLTTLGYTVTDMAASQTLYNGAIVGSGVESSQTWTLDPTGSRFSGSAITPAGGTPVTKTDRYDDTGDSPALIDEGDGTTTRPVTDIAGEMTATSTLYSSGTSADLTWQLTNLHGDTAATLKNTAGVAPVPTVAVDEYGQQLDPPASALTAGTTPGRYNWLGGHQRSAEDLTGLTLMGVRLYSPATGRFLTVDSVPGGNANAYVYAADPINGFDLDGRSWWSSAAHFVKRHWKAIAVVAAIVVVSVVVVAVAPEALAFLADARAAGQAVEEAENLFAAGARGAKGIKSTAEYTERAANMAGRRWVGPGARVTSKGLARGEGAGEVGFRSAASKGAWGRSANLTRSVRGRHDYFNYHIRIR